MTTILAIRDERGRFLPGSKPPKEMQARGGRACVERNGRAHMAKIGSRGYRAALRSERGGPEKIGGKLQEWRREHPSDLERRVAGWLLVPGDRGIWPERNYEVTMPSGNVYYLDFAWPNEKAYVEADGHRWHSWNRPGGGPEWDARRDAELAAEGWQGIRLSQAEIEDESGRDRLRVWLAATSADISDVPF